MATAPEMLQSGYLEVEETARVLKAGLCLEDNTSCWNWISSTIAWSCCAPSMLSWRIESGASPSRPDLSGSAVHARSVAVALLHTTASASYGPEVIHPRL